MRTAVQEMVQTHLPPPPPPFPAARPIPTFATRPHPTPHPHHPNPIHTINIQTFPKQFPYFTKPFLPHHTPSLPFPSPPLPCNICTQYPSLTTISLPPPPLPHLLQLPVLCILFSFVYLYILVVVSSQKFMVVALVEPVKCSSQSAAQWSEW